METMVEELDKQSALELLSEPGLKVSALLDPWIDLMARGDDYFHPRESFLNGLWRDQSLWLRNGGRERGLRTKRMAM